jgi:hypothetical protein
MSQIYFVMKLYMFRRFRLSIIRSLFTVHSGMVYVIQVCRQLSSRNICSCSKAVYKPVWHILLLSVQWINSWRWTDEISETCRVSWQNKFVKLGLLAGFITKKFKKELFTTYLLIHFGLLTQIMNLYDSVHKGLYFLKLFYDALLLNYIVSKIDECVWSTDGMILTGKLKY